MKKSADRYNCPNCGAPIDSTVCPYCGTTFYDFASIGINENAYVRIKVPSGQILVFKAYVIGATWENTINEYPKFTAEFMILPDDRGVLWERRNIIEHTD